LVYEKWKEIEDFISYNADIILCLEYEKPKEKKEKKQKQGEMMLKVFIKT